MATHRSLSFSDLPAGALEERLAHAHDDALRPRGASASPRGRGASPAAPGGGSRDLARLAAQMQRQLSIKTRRHQLWRHRACFRGSEAAAWLARNAGCADHAAALRLGQAMLDAGLFRRVASSSGFSDSASALFRFEEAGVCGSGPAAASQSRAESSSGDAHRRSPSPGSSLLPGQATAMGLFLTEQQQACAQLQAGARELRLVVARLGARVSQLEQENAARLRALSRLHAALAAAAAVVAALAAAAALLLCRSLQLCGGRQAAAAGVALAGAAALALLRSRSRRSARAPEPGLQPALGSGVGDPQPSPCAALPCYHGRSRDGARPRADGLPKLRLNALPPVVAGAAPETCCSASSSGSGSSSSSSGSGAGEPAGQEAGSPGPNGPPRREDFAGWPDAPLLLRARRLPGQQLPAHPDGRIPVNTGEPIPFESELFAGCAVIWVRGLASAPPGLFAGQRRRTSITVQGRFRRPLACEAVLSGQEFSRPAAHLPAARLVDAVLARVVRSFSPSLAVGPMSAPYVLAPVLAIAQEAHAALPGQQPDPARPVPEDLSLFDASLTDRHGRPLSAAARRRAFADPRRRRRAFTTEHVWTFTLYQSSVNMATYELDVALRVDLARHLDGQPLQFHMKDQSSNSYLFNFEAWHEKLLPAAWRAFRAGV